MDAKFLGMFFNQNQVASDDEPSTDLVIKKDTMNRSSGEILGRFSYKFENKAKLVWEVTIDGIKLGTFNNTLPTLPLEGNIDTTLFRWPGTAKANKLGKHIVNVKTGMIDKFMENSKMIIEDTVDLVDDVTFTVTLE